ncbi:chemotaxis protein histidine kinase CheA [Kitasatospora sp. GAS204A]|nr:chemotaxis protein histidine kinase CheA [Kitasatospora sp. GAS204B]
MTVLPVQNADVPPQDRSAGPADDRTPERTSDLAPDLRDGLLRYADLGGFTLAADTHAWYAAADTVTGPEEARAASTVLAEVRGCDLSVLREAAALLAGEAALRAPATLAEVLTLLALLRRVRETATTLRSGAYEADLDALAAATANGSWRKERGLRISWGRRRKLRAEAKRLAVADRPRRDALHLALVAAAAEHSEWQALSAAPGTTARPVDAELLESTGLAADTLVGALRGLGRLLADRELTELSFAELGDLVDALAADEGTLFRLPELRTLRTALEDGGLTELLAELTEDRADRAAALAAYLRSEGEDVAEATAEDEGEDEGTVEAAALVADVAEPEVESEPEIELPAQSVAEPVAEVAEVEVVEAVLPAQSVAEPEIESVTAEPEAEVVVEPEVEPEAVVEPDADADSEVEPEVEASQPVEAIVEPEPLVEAETEADVESAADVVAEPAVEREVAPEPEPELVVESEPEAVTLPEPELEAEPAVEAPAPVEELPAPADEPLATEEPAAVEPAVEEPAAEEPAAEEVDPAAKRSRRPKRPELTPGRPITAYSADELLALVRWIDSDYVERTDDELLRAAMKELGFARLGPRIKEALATAVTAARAA